MRQVLGLVDIPESEKAVYDCVSMNKFMLFRFIMEFQNSVNLFELLERGGGPPSVGVFGGVFSLYRMIAARDGALNIYHFGRSLAAIRNQLGACRSITNIDRIKVREAGKVFRLHFPHVDSVRHAIAHAGELYSTPAKMENEKLKQHTHTSGHGFFAAGGTLVSALSERTYSIGFEGEVFSVTLDNQTISILITIRNLVDSAFPVPTS